jgi:hypothetical protein
MKTWSAGGFVLLLVLALSLFAAVGLALAAVAVRRRHPTVLATATVLYDIYLAAYLWVFVPRSY